METLETIEHRLEQKRRRRAKRKHPPMKVSGKSVFTLRRVIIAQGKKKKRPKAD